MTDKTLQIVLIEDNQMLSENITMYLKLKNIDVISFFSVEEASEFIENNGFDILVLDINLPGKSGLEYLSELRQKGKTFPIIMLTSQNTSDDIVLGFESGANEYISKPFNFEEFVARLKNLSRLRNNYINKKVLIDIENEDLSNNIKIEIDLEHKKKKKNGVTIYLPTLEYKLLEYFIKQRGKIVARDTLYEEVWGEFDKYQLSRTVDVYIGYLRKKLGKNLIQTKKGDGYFIA
ncbi:MAG: response regulator transcription factor [Candidatus Gracilibacteria bacterium]|nr:response regulator transcription factor [Candidatus Gracilibacteria bacterium]